MITREIKYSLEEFTRTLQEIIVRMRKEYDEVDIE